MTLKLNILHSAVWLAQRKGLTNLTRESVSARVPCGCGTINFHFQSMEGLRSAVMRYAIENDVMDILVRAWAERNPHLLRRMTPALTMRISNHILGR